MCVYYVMNPCLSPKRVGKLLPEEKRDFIDITTRRMPLDMNCAFQVSSLSPKIGFQATENTEIALGRIEAVTGGISRRHQVRLQPPAGRSSEVLQKFPPFLHLFLEQTRRFILAALGRNSMSLRRGVF